MQKQKTMTASSGNNNYNNKVRVVARIRPLSSKEKDAGSHETLSVLGKDNNNDNSHTSLVQVDVGDNNNENHASSNNNHNNKRWFELDAVLDGNSTQEQVYAQSGAQQAITVDMFAGYNCSILAYGQTGSGKTFTMGTASCNGSEQLDEHAGIIPRATADLFATIQEKCESSTVTLSYLELYNEQIRDLFSSSDEKAPAAKGGGLRLRESPQGEVLVMGAVEKTVTSSADIGRAMETAGKKRVVAATAMNATSSRSHAICTLRIQGTLKKNKSSKFSSKLTLVDLAGSERIKKTGAQGARQTEGININKSLLVLGQVVSALSQQSSGGGSSKGARKPPYRDSKLTRLLQDCLGGNSRTIMVACVSPAHVNVEETTNTLRYAASARRITNTARQNVSSAAASGMLSPSQAAALRKENESLKTEVSDLKAQLAAAQQAAKEAQEQAEQARLEAAAEKPHGLTPRRTMSRATTLSTSGLSEDDEFNSVDEDDDGSVIDPDQERGEDEQHIPSTTHVPDQINVESSSNDSVSQKEELVEENNENSLSSESTTEEIIEKTFQDIDEQMDEKAPWRSKQKYASTISNLKLTIAELTGQLDHYELLQAQHAEVQNELEEVKAEAETARMAATYLSDIVDELRDLKRDEIEKKQQQLQMVLKEQNWIAVVHVMLENYKMQVGQLSVDFTKNVVRTIDNLPLKTPEPPAAATASTTSTETDDSATATATATATTPAAGEGSQEQQQEQPVVEPAAAAAAAAPVEEQPPPPPRRKANRRRSWWGGEVVVKQPEPEKPKPILPWKECASKFEQQIRRVEDMLKDEAASMQSIQISLTDEVAMLEKEIGERELQAQSIFQQEDKISHDLVDRLSSALLQQQQQTPAVASS